MTTVIRNDGSIVQEGTELGTQPGKDCDEGGTEMQGKRGSFQDRMANLSFLFSLLFPPRFEPRRV